MRWLCSQHGNFGCPWTHMCDLWTLATLSATALKHYVDGKSLHYTVCSVFRRGLEAIWTWSHNLQFKIGKGLGRILFLYISGTLCVRTYLIVSFMQPFQPDTRGGSVIRMLLIFINCFLFVFIMKLVLNAQLRAWLPSQHSSRYTSLFLGRTSLSCSHIYLSCKSFSLYDGGSPVSIVRSGCFWSKLCRSQTSALKWK